MLLFNTAVSLGDHITNTNCKREPLAETLFKNPQVLDTKDNSRWFCAFLLEGDSRLKINAETAQVISFDFDDSTKAELNVVAKHLKEVELEFIIHTSFSHTPEVPRYRLILPLSRPVNAYEYTQVWDDMVTTLGLPKPDPCTRRIATAVYLPSCPQDRLQHYKYVPNEGNPWAVSDEYKAPTVNEDPDVDTDAFPLMPPSGLSESMWLGMVCDAYNADKLSYFDWVEMGMALHTQTNGSDDGLKLFDEWSKRDIERYNESEIKTKWGSFARKSGARIGLGTILNKPVGVGVVVEDIVVKNVIEVAGNSEELNNITDHVRVKSRLLNQNIITEALFTRQKDLFGSSTSKASIKKELFEDDSKPDIDLIDKTFFYDRVVHNKSDKCYYVIESGERLPYTSFDLRYRDRSLPNKRGGGFKQMHKFLITESAYDAPREILGVTFNVSNKRLIEENGNLFLNGFDPKSWPSYDQEWGEHPCDTDIVKCVDDVLNILSNGKAQNKSYLLRHLAWIRQNPNQRVHHGFILSSAVGGIGKSTWEKVYRSVLGHKNVTSVSSMTLKADYNDWMTRPVLMGFVTELKTEGQRENSFSNVTEALKEMMTSDLIDVKERYASSRLQRVTMSLGMLNNDMAIRLDDGMVRRFLNIRSEIFSSDVRGALTKLIGRDSRKMFTEINFLMDECPERFAAYFDQIDLGDFDPDYLVKDSALEEIENSTWGSVAQAIKEIIDQQDNPELINKDFIHVPSLKDRLMQHDLCADYVKYMHTTWFKAQIVMAIQSLGYKVAMTNSSTSIKLGFGGVTACRASSLYLRSGFTVSDLLLGRSLVDDMRAKLADSNYVYVNDLREEYGVDHYATVKNILEEIGMVEYPKRHRLGDEIKSGLWMKEGLTFEQCRDEMRITPTDVTAEIMDEMKAAITNNSYPGINAAGANKSSLGEVLDLSPSKTEQVLISMGYVKASNALSVDGVRYYAIYTHPDYDLDQYKEILGEKQRLNSI